VTRVVGGFLDSSPNWFRGLPYPVHGQRRRPQGAVGGAEGVMELPLVLADAMQQPKAVN